MLLSTISDVMAQWLFSFHLSKIKLNYFLLYWLAYNALRVGFRFVSAQRVMLLFVSGRRVMLVLASVPRVVLVFVKRSASGVSLHQRSTSGATFRLAFRTVLLFVILAVFNRATIRLASWMVLFFVRGVDVYILT